MCVCRGDYSFSTICFFSFSFFFFSFFFLNSYLTSICNRMVMTDLQFGIFACIVEPKKRGGLPNIMRGVRIWEIRGRAFV